jgi:hypothetical protein
MLTVSSARCDPRRPTLISGRGMRLELGVSSRTQLAAEVSRPPGRD